jgi:flagellar biosynthesis/type III secretory pathway protein FliH
VETDTSFVDATVETRISAIAFQMLGGEREGDHAA